MLLFCFVYISLWQMLSTKIWCFCVLSVMSERKQTPFHMLDDDIVQTCANVSKNMAESCDAYINKHISRYQKINGVEKLKKLQKENAYLKKRLLNKTHNLYKVVRENDVLKWRINNEYADRAIASTSRDTHTHTIPSTGASRKRQASSRDTFSAADVKPFIGPSSASTSGAAGQNPAILIECPNCPKTFANQASYRQHYYIECKKPFQCPQCQVCFLGISSLHSHKCCVKLNK